MKTLLSAAMALCALWSAAEAADASKPDVVTYSASVAAMEDRLSGHCAAQTTRETDPFMPIHEKQHQIDCEGFDYFGAARKAEFVFGDDTLIFVWILTQKDEEAALETAFRGLYGEPTHVTPAFTAFADDNAAIRKDVPEALFYSPAISDQYRAFFDSQLN